MRAVGLYLYVEVGVVQGIDKGGQLSLQRRFSASYDGMAGLKPEAFIHDVVDVHLLSLVVHRIAKGTSQVAAARADKYGGRAGVVALALNGAEYLVNLHNRGLIVYFIRSLVVQALHHIHTIGLRDLFANPPGNILCRRIERQDVV